MKILSAVTFARPRRYETAILYTRAQGQMIWVDLREQENVFANVRFVIAGVDDAGPQISSGDEPAPDAESSRAAGPSFAKARHKSFRAAEQRALAETQRRIGDVQCVQAMQASSASADAAASQGTEVFGARGQWRLRETLKRRRSSPNTAGPHATASPSIGSQTLSTLPTQTSQQQSGPELEDDSSFAPLLAFLLGNQSRKLQCHCEA